MNQISLTNKSRRAWTLIEVIGVLAVIAILAAVLLPVLIRQLDKSVAEQERAVLQSFGDAFQQYVMTTRTVPDQTTWYSTIASKLGISTNDVLYNPHQQAHQQTRVFLIDAALLLGSLTNGLPYNQASYVGGSGGPMLPLSPRLMIVSSLGKALPTNFVSGVLATNYFSDLWNVADGTVPSDAAWTGWTGDPKDVNVQRVNLAPLFVHLLLANYLSTTAGGYTIDGVDGVGMIQVVNVDGYFIQGSVITFYSPYTSTAVDSKQILTRDASYVYESGVWRGSILGAALVGVGSLGDTVDAFMNATANIHAKNYSATNQNVQQVLIVSDMLSYISNYNVWAAGNFTNSSLKTSLQGLENTMMTDMRNIYQSGGTSYYPTNAVGCP